MDAAFVLPEEIWRRIFSFLTDYQLGRSVIPVCRLFRDLAYGVGFRQLGAEDGANLGHDWRLWFDLHPAFLRRIHSPKVKRLEFKLSKECLAYLREPDMNFGLGLVRRDSVEDEDSPLFNVGRSLDERMEMIETLKAFPDLETLKVVHQSYERFGNLGPRSSASVGADESSRRVSPRTNATSDCPTATAEFLQQMLGLVQIAIKELELNLSCVCPRVSERRRGPDVSEKGGHSCTSLPLFGTLQATPICSCVGLTSLTLNNGVNGRALELFAISLTNLKNLHLSECGNLKGFELKIVSNRISEGALSKLESLHLKALSGFYVRAADLNDFFTFVPTWTGALTSLGIDFSVYQEEHDDGSGFDLNPIFLICDKIRRLNLHAHLTTAPDFRAITKLTDLRLVNFAWIADRGDLRPSSPTREALPAPAPWNKITTVTSLTIRLHDLPPLATSIVDWQRCFGRLSSLCLLDTDRSNAFAYVRRILSVCGPSLKRFVMESLYEAEPLEIVDQTDFQFTSLDLGEGGEVLWRNLPSASFQFLTDFKFSVGAFHLASNEDDPAIVAFILRVCESAASSLRHLDLETNLPVKNLPLLARLRKLVTLKIHFYEEKLRERESVASFYRACNRIFPVVNIDRENGFADEVSSEYLERF